MIMIFFSNSIDIIPYTDKINNNNKKNKIKLKQIILCKKIHSGTKTLTSTIMNK
jgi:hypothetical protein